MIFILLIDYRSELPFKIFVIPLNSYIINFIVFIKVKNKNVITFKMLSFAFYIGKIFSLCTTYHYLAANCVFIFCNCSVQCVVYIRKAFYQTAPNGSS